MPQAQSKRCTARQVERGQVRQTSQLLKELAGAWNDRFPMRCG